MRQGGVETLVVYACGWSWCLDRRTEPACRRTGRAARVGLHGRATATLRHTQKVQEQEARKSVLGAAVQAMTSFSREWTNQLFLARAC